MQTTCVSINVENYLSRIFYIKSRGRDSARKGVKNGVFRDYFKKASLIFSDFLLEIRCYGTEYSCDYCMFSENLVLKIWGQMGSIMEYFESFSKGIHRTLLISGLKGDIHKT